MEIQQTFDVFRKKIKRADDVRSQYMFDSIKHIRTMIALKQSKIPSRKDCAQFYYTFRCLAFLSHGPSTFSVQRRLDAEKAMCDFERRWSRIEYNKKTEYENINSLLWEFYDTSFHEISEQVMCEKIRFISEKETPFGLPFEKLLRMNEDEIIKWFNKYALEIVRTCIKQTQDMLAGKYDDVSGFGLIDDDLNANVEDAIAGFNDYLLGR